MVMSSDHQHRLEGEHINNILLSLILVELHYPLPDGAKITWNLTVKY